jgi:hypothetical protein
MEIGKFSITAITAITEAIPKVGYIFSYSCGKNEFPGKRYNASTLSRREESSKHKLSD